MIKEKSLQAFMDELASKAATPGGGSVAAVMGAMGAALASMVCHLTIGKKKYEAFEVELQDTRQQAEKLRETLTDMIHADIEAFDGLMTAYGMPKEMDEEKTIRSEAIQQALQKATDVPLDCAKACAKVIDLCRQIADKGNPNVISDVGVGVLAADAALKSAALNVYINAGSIKDKKFAEKRLEALHEILKNVEGKANSVYELVKTKL